MELKSIKKKFDRVLALVLTIAALMAGQNVWATTKTVTYTLSREKVEGRNYWALTHSGSTPFDGTTTVQSQPEDYYTQATFHLPDNFIFTFNWNGGTVTNVSGTYFMCQNENVKFSLTWSGTSRYVTNVSVTDDQGNPSSLNGSGSATTDYNYAEQGSASYTLKTYANFVRLVITYSDAPGLSVFQSAGTNTYKISNQYDLRHLADYVNNGGNNCQGLTFLQTKDITCDNTYIPIAHRTSITDETSFNGTYDGQGNTVSGITANYSGNYVGMFGYNEGTIRNVVLASSTFTGYSNVGGIVGSNDGTVENCRVESSVSINAATNGSSNLGGIAGANRGLVIGCISAATVSTPNNYTYSKANGGIVGCNSYGQVRNCLYTGTNVSVLKNKGAIVGLDDGNNGTFTNNYYTNIDLGGVNGSDQNGARRARAVTLGENITLMGNETIYNYSGITAIGTTALKSGTTIYSGATQTLSLSYVAAAIPDGYDVLLSVTQTASGDAVTFTDHGDHTYTIPMPAADITVSVTQIPVISYIDADGNPQSHACTPIVEGTTSYQTLGRTEGWYVVNSDVTISGTQGVKFLDQQVNIILCDGTTLTSNATTTGYEGIEVKNGSLAIYGQSLGTGSIVATASDYPAISSKTSINLNGGIISGITNSGIAAITNDSSGSITIRRGNVTATGSTFGIRDLGNSSGIVILGGTVNATATHATNGIGLYSVYGDISIMGGNVTATGSCAGIEAGGINATGTITLGCTTPADRITASSYDCATLTITDGQILSDGISSHTFTGTLSSEQIAAIAGKTLMKSLGDVAYLDGSGQAQTCSDYTILWDSTIPVDGSDEGSIGTADQDTWYVASTDYTFGKKLNALGHVHLILLDGATFTVNGTEIGLNAKDLSIYGQSLGTGTVTASATDKAMFVDGNLVINGGTTNATGGNYGIYVDGGYLAINGGTVNATGTTKGIYVNVTLSKVGNHLTATFDGTSLARVNIPTNIAVNSVVLDRTFTVGKPATIMLPFSKNVSDISGAKFYTFGGVTYNGNTGKWEATMNEVAGSIAANTPYLVVPSATSITFNGGATLNTTGGGGQQTTDAGNNWTFYGTYTNLTYGTEPMTGHIYGFASKSKTVDGHEVEAGDFVHAKEGASVPPMRCYLTYKNGAQRALMRASALGATGSDTEAPSRITVRLVSASGTVTAVGTFDTVTGEMDIDTWYDMNGRLLETEPTAPGLYIHNGKTIMIKE